MNYTIYQLPVSNKRKFREYKRGELSIDDYVAVYDGTIAGNNVNDALLDDIWELLNINHPEDYHAHSLSVSDIIEINEKYYYVEPFGFKEVFSNEEHS